MTPSADVRRVFQNVGIAACATEMAGRFIFANDAYLRMSGRTEQELSSGDYRWTAFREERPYFEALVPRLRAAELAEDVAETAYERAEGGNIRVRRRVWLVPASEDAPAYVMTQAEDITERKGAQEEWISAPGRMRKDAEDLLSSQDQELRAAALELHRGAAQFLAALTLQLSATGHARNNPGRANDAADMAVQCAAAVRAVEYSLYPPLLEQFGLGVSLQAWIENSCGRTGTEVNADIRVDGAPIPRNIQMTVFRALKEGMEHVTGGSLAPPVWLSLKQDSDRIRLELVDNSGGLQAKGLSAGLKVRVALLGGLLDMVAEQGSKARLTLVLPLPSTVSEP